MEDLEERLLWKKYTPKTLDDIILLPRVRKLIENDNYLDNHLLLYGHYGLGKSALTEILIKDKAYLYKNTSKDTTIEILRKDITEFSNKMADIFNPTSRYKLVYLDEFERASPEYQDSLKGFINDNSDNIRFIFVTNHIHKIEKGLMSRCTEINFDPVNDKEILWWKSNAKNRLIDIAHKEGIEIGETDIKKIVSYNYPDIRKMIIVLSEVKKTGTIQYSATTYTKELKDKLYNTLTSGNILDIQSFILTEFGQENIQSLFNLCGKPLLEMLIKKQPNIIKTDKLGDIYYNVSEHSMMLNTIKGGDPIVVGTSCLNKIKNIIV